MNLLLALFVGLGGLKRKLSDQELSFFLLSVVVGSWLQLGGASAKVTQATALAVPEALSAILNFLQYTRQDTLGPRAYGSCGQMLENSEGWAWGDAVSDFFSLFYMAFCNNLEPEKMHWKTFFRNQRWLYCVQHLWKIKPLTFCLWFYSSPEWESDLQKWLRSLRYHSEGNIQLLRKERTKVLCHVFLPMFLKWSSWVY